MSWFFYDLILFSRYSNGHKVLFASLKFNFHFSIIIGRQLVWFRSLSKVPTPVPYHRCISFFFPHNVTWYRIVEKIEFTSWNWFNISVLSCLGDHKSFFSRWLIILPMSQFPLELIIYENFGSPTERPQKRRGFLAIRITLKGSASQALFLSPIYM